MTFRQSVWHRPGDAQGLYSWLGHQATAWPWAGHFLSGEGSHRNRRESLVAYIEPLPGGLSLWGRSCSQQTSLHWGSPICVTQTLRLPVTFTSRAQGDLSKLA